MIGLFPSYKPEEIELINFRVTSCKNQKYATFLRLIQVINDVSDVLHPLSGYNSGSQNLIKNMYYQYPMRE